MSATLAIAILSAGVGALLGGVIRAVVDRYAAFNEAKGIAVALEAEIQAVIEIVRHRRYLEHLDRLITSLQDPAYSPGPGDLFAIQISQDYFAVFNAITPRIGLLGDLSGRVVSLYVFAKALLEDLIDLRSAQEKVLNGQLKLDRHGLIDRTKNIKILLDGLLQRGAIVSAGLATYAGRRWLRVVP